MIERLLNPIKARIRLMIGRCVVNACKGSEVELSLLAGEVREDVDFYQQYGFSSRPVGNVSGISVFIGGSRDNGALVACRGDDIKMDLEEGEVAIHSPHGNSLVLKKDGSIVATPKAGKKFHVEGAIEATLEITANCDKVPTNLSTHTHPTPVGPSGSPIPGT